MYNRGATGVCENNNPPKMNTRKIGFRSAKPGAGLQSLLVGRMAKAQVKGVVVSQTPV